MFNRRIKPLVVILLALIPVLVIVLIRFQLKINQEAGTVPDGPTLADGSYLIYQDEESGLYGVVDSVQRIIIEPVWESLTPVPGGNYIAGRTLHRSLLYCMVDREEKLVIPEIYSAITPISDTVYAAKTAGEGTLLFYNSQGTLLLSQAWNSYSCNGSTLRLTGENLACTAELSEDCLTLTAMQASAPMLDKKITLSFSASDLTAVRRDQVLPKLAAVSARYLSAMLQDNYAGAYAVSDANSYNEVIYNGLFAGCSLTTAQPKRCTAVTEQTGDRYLLQFLISYVRVLTPATGDQPASTARCSRVVQLELAFHSDGSLLIQRVTPFDEQILTQGESQDSAGAEDELLSDPADSAGQQE